MPQTEYQKLVMQNKQLLTANRNLLNENDQLRTALKQKLRNDPTYLNKLLEIRG
jgi:hypothetical protein